MRYQDPRTLRSRPQIPCFVRPIDQNAKLFNLHITFDMKTGSLVNVYVKRLIN